MKPRVIGTAGHIDHGKTALVRELTGVDCDRLPEEKQRGITIDLGFANWNAGEFQIGFIDVPGHERFVKNMLAGVGGIDSVLLVVAADESIKPQTREHFAICRLLQIPTGVVAITKSDLVDPEIVEIVRMEIEELVRGSFLEGKPIVPVSSVTGEGLDALRHALLAEIDIPSNRDRAESRPFRLPIDRVFSLHGFGTVVTGTAMAGSLAVDRDVEVLPEGLHSRARSIQVHGSARGEATAGERTSINLPDIPLEDLRRGQQVVSPGSFRPSRILTARLELLDDASAPLRDNSRVRFHLYSAEILGTVRIVDDSGDRIAPGNQAWVQIRLEAPVVAVAGDRFVVRKYSPAFTVGGGMILDPHIGKLKKKSRSEIFKTLEEREIGKRLPLLARLAGARGLSLGEVGMRTGVAPGEILRQITTNDLDSLARLGEGNDTRWIHEDHLLEMRRQAMNFLRSYFMNNRLATSVPKGEFIQKLLPAGAPSQVIGFFLDDLKREGIIDLQGDLVDVPGRSKELGGSEGALAREIEMRFLAAGLQPPSVSELIQTIHQKNKVIEGVVGFLAKTGVLVRIADGVYLHRDVLAEARRRLEQHRGETVDVGWFKNLYGISRKVVIPLLELFDRESLTKRVGDRRVILQGRE